MSPPPTDFVGPLKGALPVARQSRFHGSHSAGHDDGTARAMKAAA